MPITLPAAPITEALTAQWRTIQTLAEALDERQWHTPSVLPGWSQADIVAHIIGTESLLAGRSVDPVPDAPAADHVRNPIGELNENWVQHFRDQSRAQVLAALDEILQVRTAALTAMSQQQFDEPTVTPAGPDTYGRFMRIRIFDCWMHEIDLRDVLDGSVPADPNPARWAVDEIATSLPFVVGKRAGMPSGTRVLFEITGLAARTVRVEVGDRAAIVDAFGDGDRADVTLTVDTVDFARLVGGRRGADPGTVDIAGDRARGERIVGVLDYVI
ncbi:maleylpyruvate isomerase family mycothiol-dependent enzyme [Gordonia sp. ABSL1-1]|uniref:maleylpyruvate isomerase family mycothiol-dependent enzyme n=1 Tax=Gordonia sp. ABSL1-1 TaxID=3053923 RepID=UPI0025739C7A|nr:maleylpyruvate isomerase family mycothiol-dependent enzyme [Gordonia sp. ABSL1-1]MDL9937319.1 maleylpyruvate isomerase family mycothiol-dependent enzyme [Gordonia sp. ABSL1-1]